MTGLRQAAFVRQRRIDVIQRALSSILDHEAWSAATPRRLHIGAADASSHGWTMIIPQLTDFLLADGGTGTPRIVRLAVELRCPAYVVDLRGAPEISARGGSSRERPPEGDVTLVEVDPRGVLHSSGARQVADIAPAEPAPRFELIEVPDAAHERIAALDGVALADYLGALVGFPAWTRHGDDPFAAGALSYEPREAGRTRELASAGLRARSSGTREATARTTRRAAPPAHDRRGTRPRSASRPRR